jgi:hypothetical protein
MRRQIYVVEVKVPKGWVFFSVCSTLRDARQMTASITLDMTRITKFVPAGSIKKT